MGQSLEAYPVADDIGAHELEHPAWGGGGGARLARYWSGAEAPRERQASARLLWSPAALLVRFECQQHEPLVVSREPQTAKKTARLWERDVCEVFIAPDAAEPRRYYEFEAAPTGEWLDLKIHQLREARETDWEYVSGMTVAARLGAESFLLAMRLPWEAFGQRPRAGERWRANLFRCIGSGPERGYLAWQPTRTPQPNFHVPEAFGELLFSEAATDEHTD